MMKYIGRTILFTITLLLLVACGESTSEIEKATKKSVKENTEDYYETLIAKFEPLGDMPIPEDNPMTERKIELGKTLFFDARLSGNDELSCASCHAPGLGYSDGLPLFSGFEGVEGPRRTPTIINAGYYTSYFWDGRADSLEEQALGPISSPIEMNMNLDELVDKMEQIDGYSEMFADTFDEKITLDNIGKALGAFQRTIVIDTTRFDQFLTGDFEAMTEEEVFGMDLFANKARCIACHNGPHLTDQRFHNVGVESEDIGRKEITKLNANDGAFRTSGLYGISHHAPYMHDGSLGTLEEVIDFYNRGGDDHPNKSPIIQELNLSDEEQEALLAFLYVISGEEVPEMEMPTLPGK